MREADRAAVRRRAVDRHRRSNARVLRRARLARAASC